MNTYTIWFILFAFTAYFIVTDESVAKAFYYVTRIIRNKFEVFKWWFVNNPRTPWTRYLIWKRSNRLAKELIKELENKKEV